MIKKIIILPIFAMMIGCLSSPVYDATTVKNMVEMKKIYQDDVKLAKTGSLSIDIETSALDFFDSAIAREEAKNNE